MLNKLVVNAEIQHRALKLRIYPTKEQEILINKTFGCCRQIYNNRLFERNQFYDNVIKQESDKTKQKELWKTIKLSTEKEMGEKYTQSYADECAFRQNHSNENAFDTFFEALPFKLC